MFIDYYKGAIKGTQILTCPGNQKIEAALAALHLALRMLACRLPGDHDGPPPTCIGLKVLSWSGLADANAMLL